MKGISIPDNTTDVRILGNTTFAKDRDIQVGSTLSNNIIEDNVHRATGRNAVGSINSIYYAFQPIENTRFVDNVVNGAEYDGTQHTVYVFFVEESFATTGDVNL